MLDNDESQSLSYHEICVQIKKLVLFCVFGQAEAVFYSIKGNLLIKGMKQDNNMSALGK